MDFINLCWPVFGPEEIRLRCAITNIDWLSENWSENEPADCQLCKCIDFLRAPKTPFFKTPKWDWSHASYSKLRRLFHLQIIERSVTDRAGKHLGDGRDILDGSILNLYRYLDQTIRFGNNRKIDRINFSFKIKVMFYLSK